MTTAFTAAILVVASALLWEPNAALACIDPDLGPCTTTYTQNLQGSVIRNKDQYCGVLRNYYSCVEGVCGTVPQDITDFIIEAQASYFDCGIGGARTTVSVSLLLMLSAVLSTRVLQ